MNPRLRKTLAGKAFRRITGAFVGILALYFLSGYFAVDPLAKRILPWVAENRLASRISVDKVEFDPLRLILEVDNLRLGRKDGGTLLVLGHLYADLEADGLFKRAWHLRDIRLTGPGASLEIRPDGTLNWSELIAKLNEDKEPDDGKIPRVLLDHILIEQGRLHYADRNRPTPYVTELSPLALELDGFSTLPQDRGQYLIAARMPDHGAVLRWKGTFGANPLASAGTVELSGVRLPRVMEVVKRQTLPVTITAGTAGARLDYDFAMVNVPGTAEPKPKAILENLSVEVADLAAALNPQTTLTLSAANATFPRLDLALHTDSNIRWQNMQFNASEFKLKHESEHLLQVSRAEVEGIAFDTASRRLDIAGIVLRAGEIQAARARDGRLDWQKIGPVAGDAPVAPGPASGEASPLRFSIASVQLQQWKASYADSLFVHPLRARIEDIDLSLAVRDEGDGIVIDGLKTGLANLTLHSAPAPQPVARLERITLADSTIHLKDSTAKLGAIKLSGLQTQVTVDAQRKINWQSVLESAPAPAADAKPASPSAWKIALDSIALDNSGVHIEDRSSGAPVVLDVQNARLELKDGSLDFAKAVPIKAGFTLKQGGSFEVSGRLAPAPLKGDLDLKLEGLPLKLFSPYLNRHALLKIADGQAGVRGKLSIKPGKTFSGQFAGGFNVGNLAIVEEIDNRPFLSWKSVSSDSLRLSIAPDRLHMDALHIAHPVGRVIIFEDKTLNVQRMLRPPATGTAPSAKAAASAPAEAFPVTVDRVSVVDGDIEFADLSLTPQFGTHMHTLGGVINGLSADAAGTAQVELDGKVDEYGSARIRGAVQPFRATEFTDLKLAFRNLEMNRLTPYSGKFAGRRIDSGKLSVDLEYKIKNRQLSGENKFVINTLKLGERVESPDAVNLPLDLAIALLEDSNGVIDLDLPISGSLDDPQFSYGKIVWKAIVNVIGKIATAPFRALGKLLGISADKLEAIVFDPGSATLAPPEQEKLKAIADAMGKRPSLALRISPAFDTGADKAALQETATRRDVVKEMGLTLKEGEQPGPLDLSNVKVQSAVENLLKDRTGQKRNLKAMDAVRDYFKKPKPEDLPKYEAMLAQLKASANVTDADLVALAKARAAAIQGYLVEKGGLEPGRVSAQEPAKSTGDGKAVTAKMELGVARGGNP